MGNPAGTPHATKWRKADLAEIEAIPAPGRLEWLPIRRHFGIDAFGINAYTATQAEQDVVELHTEEVRQHEEAYVVLSGSATFTLDDEEVEAAAGSLIFVRDPSVERSAVATEGGTTVLAIGARKGVPYIPGPWEPIYVARALGAAGDVAGAIDELKRGLELHPDHRMLLYRLASWEARAGRRDDALVHLTAAVTQSAALREQAQTDEAFDSVREDARFPTGS